VVQEAKKLSPPVFLLSITPVDESSPQKNALKVRKNEYVRLYNEQIKKIVEEEKVGLIDANQAFLESTTQLLCEDGLHPNAEGHRILFELVKGHIPFLQENS
jgi:lysophospholipase L1-like esterase